MPVLLVVNKAEGRALEWDVDVFRRLGVGGEPIAISAQNGEGIADLRARILEQLPGAPAEGPRREAVMKLAVVGRRNAGKSTLINAWAREQRMIVSEVPGTTRDAVDVVFERDGRSFVAIDTAGVRKRAKVADAIEFFGEARSRRTMRRADVVVLLVDVTLALSAIEKSLARYALDHHKPLILAANKWDLVEDRDPKEYEAYLSREMPGVAGAPVVFLAGATGFNVDALLDVATDLFGQSRLRVGTGELNRVLERALEARSPSSAGYRVKVRYATQTDVAPPTFVLFVNDKSLIGKAWLRYLENRLREELPFPEVPVRIVLREASKAAPGESSS